MKLRKHQKDLNDIINDIIAGADIRKIIVKVVPGGGKSLIPVIAGRLITVGKADGVCWVCPRQSLQSQGEFNFLDPDFRDMLSHSLSIRTATNDLDPCRDQNGFITTYQAVGVENTGLLPFEFTQKRYILVLDEFHHVEHGGIWHKALAPMIDGAKYVILMTGTLARGDKKPIAFCDYYETPSGNKRPDLKPNGHKAVVEYSRVDALEEKAIIPIKFHLLDGNVSWMTETGSKEKTDLTKAYRGRDVSAAIYSALRTEYAEELLNRAIEHWKAHRRALNPMAKLLVVTANYQHAKKTVKFLRDAGLSTDIATSHESEAAQKAIERFKFGNLDTLVSIAMAYEGFDCKPISHIACLTHIRSTPWIEQMVARAVRIDPSIPYDRQYAHIFAPDDIRFRKIVERIRKEQLPFLKKQQKRKQSSLFGSDAIPSPGIIPLESNATSTRQVILGGNGGARETYDFTKPVKPLTPSEIEKALRQQIEKRVRLFEFNNRYRPGRINIELFRHFGKKRRDMTIAELEQVWAHIEKKYPLSHVRGTGKKRVSTKVVPWNGAVTVYGQR